MMMDDDEMMIKNLYVSLGWAGRPVRESKNMFKKFLLNYLFLQIFSLKNHFI